MCIEHSPSFERINMLIPKKTAQAGSDDPGDVSIVVQPSDQNEILIDSEVEKNIWHFYLFFNTGCSVKRECSEGKSRST